MKQLNDNHKLTLATILVAVNGGDLVTGPGRIPSGHVYARLMGQIGLSEYYALLEILKVNGLIKSKGHVLSITETGASVAREISAVIKQQSDNVTVN